MVVNEILAHEDQPLVDTIELYNTTSQPIDIGGWWLSDSSSNYCKFQIPAGTIIAGQGFQVFYEGHWVGSQMEYAADEFGGGTNGFALSGSNGDDVWLVQTDASGNVTRFADHVSFGPTLDGETYGRWQDDRGRWHFYPLLHSTLVAPDNANTSDDNAPRVGPLVISEVMYDPAPLVANEQTAGFTTAQDMEFIEIYNPTTTTVSLTNWSLGATVTYDFAAGTSLAPGQMLLVVHFNPDNAAMLAAFRSRYGNTTATVVGSYSGHLGNDGDIVQLDSPDTPSSDDPTYYPPILADEVVYDASWGGQGDGTSLHRVAADSWGDDESSWVAAPASPGTTLITAPDVLTATGADWTDAGLPDLTLTLGEDGKLHLYRTGSTIDAVPPQEPAFVSAVQVTGSGNAGDTLTIDFGGGNPIPAGGVAFDGGPGIAGGTLAIEDAANSDTFALSGNQLICNGSQSVTFANTQNLSFDLGSGTLDLGGGTQTVGGLTLLSGNVVHGSLAGSSFIVQGGSISADLTGAGALDKTGTATVVLSGVNTYSDGTTVSEGLLAINSSNALPDGGGLSVSAGGTFIFDPSISASSNDTTVVPGDSSAVTTSDTSVATSGDTSAATCSAGYHGPGSIGFGDVGTESGLGLGFRQRRDGHFGARFRFRGGLAGSIFRKCWQQPPVAFPLPTSGFGPQTDNLPKFVPAGALGMPAADRVVWSPIAARTVSDLAWLGQVANSSDNSDSSDPNHKKDMAMLALDTVFAQFGR